MNSGVFMLVVLSLVVWCFGQEERPEPSPYSGPPRAWLGFQTAKPGATTVAQLPDLPSGIGFIVCGMVAGGPAEKAGMKAFDIVWKLDDQLLVNSDQLAALLRLRKPGEEVRFSLFRGGKPMEISLTLGETPKSSSHLLVPMAGNTIFPDQSKPVRVVNLSEKRTSYSNEEGKAEVHKDDNGFRILITKPDGAALYEGSLNTLEDFRKLPKAWQRFAFALRRTLDQALAVPAVSSRPLQGPRMIFPEHSSAE